MKNLTLLIITAMLVFGLTGCKDPLPEYYQAYEYEIVYRQK